MATKIKVLFAEDEPALGMIVQESLESRGFEVSKFEDGGQVIESYLKNTHDIILLDVMMPVRDGFSIAQEIRKIDPEVPIIFLTAKSRTEDVVEGFEHGANDYLRKPFSMEELIVRMNSLLKRTDSFKEKRSLQIGRYEFNCDNQILKFGEEEELLTHKEAQLLEQLFLNKNQLTDRKLILQKIWGDDDFFTARSMDVYISKLRKKLAKDNQLKILNVRGYGYKLLC